MEATRTHRTPFTDVDTMPAKTADWMIALLDGLSAHPEIRRVRQTAAEALPPAAGQRLLDAGCGAGKDPAGKGVESVRPIRDDIGARVEKLLADLVPSA